MFNDGAGEVKRLRKGGMTGNDFKMTPGGEMTGLDLQSILKGMMEFALYVQVLST